jgi:hypothetical protein
MRDEVIVAALVVAFAGLVTSHVALVYGFLWRPPRWRAPLTLLVVPLAPYWGYRCGMRRRAIVWVSCVLAYAILSVLAAR